jgi:hypothetical protein
MAMYSFVPPFRKAMFRGVPSLSLTNLGVPRVKKKVAEHCSSPKQTYTCDFTTLSEIDFHLLHTKTKCNLQI